MEEAEKAEVAEQGRGSVGRLREVKGGLGRHRDVLRWQRRQREAWRDGGVRRPRRQRGMEEAKGS